MCGIVGVAGNIYTTQEKIFRNLLVIDAIRGEDSTGIISVPQDTSQDVMLAKEVGHPYNLLEAENIKDILGRDHSVLIGHNRFATMGKVNKENAHPFEYANIFGVHNGTLHTCYRLPDYEQFDVDSANIFYAIALDGVKETIAKLSGAYALVWFDKEKWSLNFIRNDQRTLYYFITDDETKIYWASEAHMLHLVLIRNRISSPKVRMFAEDTHYEFYLPKKRSDKLIGPERERMEGYKYIPEPFDFGGWCQGWNERDSRRNKHNRSKQQRPPFKLIEGGKKVAPLSDAEEMEFAAMLSEPNYGVDQTRDMPNVTCAACSDTIEFGKKRKFLLGEQICMDCFIDPDTREMYELEPLTKEELEDLGFEQPVYQEVISDEREEIIKQEAIKIRKLSKKNRIKRLTKRHKEHSEVEYTRLLKLVHQKGVLK